jgi:hypothetical protein
MGVCTPLNTCACATGFIGKNCNESLRVVAQTQLNFTANQLPKQLQLSVQSAVTFALTIHKVPNASNETVMATVVNYDSRTFPHRPVASVDVPPPNKTISAPSESFLLSNVTDIRIYSSLILSSSAFVIMARRWEISRRSNGASVNFTLDDPHANVTWSILRLDAGGSEFKRVGGTNVSSTAASQVTISFPVLENGYYAVFATLPPVYGQIPPNPPPTPPAASTAAESPPDYTAAIVGGVLAVLSLIGSVVYGYWRWRRSRQQAVLTMYYNAVSKKKGKLPPAPPQALASSEQHLERAVPADLQGQHLERSPLAGVAAASPSSVRPRIWNAVNRYKSAPSFSLPKSENEQSGEQPPSPIPGGDRLPNVASVQPEKSLLAAAIRSKMLRQKASIHQTQNENSRDCAAASNASAIIDSFDSESDVQSSDLHSASIELDEIELQLPAPDVDTVSDPLMKYVKRGDADSLDSADDAFGPVVEVESISEDSTIWRAHEQRDDGCVDVQSTASSSSAALSVFSALTESQATAVESEMSRAEQEDVSVASCESTNHEL